jgi:hypothetical protein
MSKTIFICIFIFNILFSAAVHAQDSITSFTNDWTLSFFSSYKQGIFTQTYTSEFRTNKPLDIGFGIRYKMFSAKFSYSLPVTNWLVANQPVTESSSAEPSFDFEFASYLGSIYFDGYFKNYRDYYVMNTNEPGGLDTLSAGIMATFVQNYKNHSVGSVMNLDKKQNISSGSLLFSLGVFFSSLHSTSEILSHYNERQNLIYFGPGIGYSYTWVFKNGSFLNASYVLYTNAGYNRSTNNWLFIPQVEPNFVFGHHFATWSVNIKVMNTTTLLLGDTAFLPYPNEYVPNATAYMLDINVLSLLTISLTLSKRF